MIESIIENFKKNNPFTGDSDKETAEKVNTFYDNLEEFKEGKKPFTLIINDPLDHSFIQNIYHPKEDERVITEIYERTDY